MVTIASRFRDRSTNIGQWRKSSSLNEKGTVVGMDYLETLPHNVFGFLNEKFICLFLIYLQLTLTMLILPV